MRVARGQDAFHAVSCPQEMPQRRTEEISNSLSISDPTVALIQALKTRAFHLLCSSLSSESDTCLPVTNSFCALQVMGVPGVLALFSSQRKNPVLVSLELGGGLCCTGWGQNVVGAIENGFHRE